MLLSLRCLISGCFEYPILRILDWFPTLMTKVKRFKKIGITMNTLISHSHKRHVPCIQVYNINGQQS